MKIQEITLGNYKKFQAEKTIPFYLSEDGRNDISVLIGNNGSGKTSILQAVALLLGTVNRRNFSYKKLDWAGFNINFCENANLSAQLLDDNKKQILVTQNRFSDTKFLPPIHSTGKCFWYTEQRNHSSIFVENQQKRKIDMDTLRQILSNALSNKNGFYTNFTKLCSKVFPNRQLHSAEMRLNNLTLPAYIFFTDGKNKYELSEMSAGERAILPLLIDFANPFFSINNSVILIDELELHLHPPLQQQLALALPLLGNNNQFIISTHSDYVVQMFAKSQLIYLDSL